MKKYANKLEIKIKKQVRDQKAVKQVRDQNSIETNYRWSSKFIICRTKINSKALAILILTACGL